MLTELNATVKVAAVFEGDRVLPRWFVWEGRRYDIKEINYNWQDRQGQEKLHCFSVTDGANNYELSFHTEKTLWRLTKVFNGS